MSACTTLGITKQEVDFLQNSVGFPAVPANKVFYVSSVSGADMAGNGSDGSRDKPFKTLDYAIGQCTADKGDVIFLMPNHAETVATASAITADVAGIFIYGLGAGETRPTFTFSTVASTIVISAASVTAKNFIVKPSIDSVVSPIVVSGSDCDLDYEHQDASATVEAVRSFLTTAGADRFTCKLKYVGFIAGNAVVNAGRLVGVDTARIWVDFYGVASTSIVEFHTTACHNIVVDGYFHNNGTSLTKNVVDTVTGSTWLASGWDGNSKSRFSGGTGVSIASDDVSAIAADTAAILTDTGTTIPATLAAIPQCVVKSDGAVLTGNDNLFVISGGPVRCKIVGVVTTVIGGASNGDLQIVTTTPAATLNLNAAPVAIDTDAAGTIYQNRGATSVFTPSTTLGGALVDPVTVEETELILTPGTVHFRSSAAQSGVIAWYMTYTPLSPLSVVTAAA